MSTTTWYIWQASRPPMRSETTKAWRLISTFIDGWILECWSKTYDCIILIGKVKHSYSITETPLKPWIIIQTHGAVECGRMAGLGESCSHVAAILFWMETALRIRSDVSCTSIPSTWLPMSMSHVNPSVPYTCKANLNMSSKGISQCF